ncbi:hypothetical protein L1887_25354 [Cichorium endivia]|nr:hypothetical protein L1887_25354 [Cichorium endivia]
MGGTTTSPTADTSAFDDSESPSLPLLSEPITKIPRDSYHLAYIIYFILGAGYVIPWNAFITAVDYFAYLYPDASVDRVFAVAYMFVTLISLLFIVFYANKWHSFVKINMGLGLFVASLLVVPVMDVTYIKGQVGLYGGFYVTVAAVALAGVAEALVSSGVMGATGEMPERYIQAAVAGTAASGKFSRFNIWEYPI